MKALPLLAALAVSLVPAAAVALVAAVVWWRTRRTGPALTPSAAP